MPEMTDSPMNKPEGTRQVADSVEGLCQGFENSEGTDHRRESHWPSVSGDTADEIAREEAPRTTVGASKRYQPKPTVNNLSVS